LGLIERGIGEMVVAWNTGRYYSDKGQRIAAAFNPDDGKLYFCDIDRGIDGSVEYSKTDNSIKEAVMRSYDASTYDCESLYGEFWKMLLDAAKAVEV
tara:strand:+ start:480 stop:770 length:291 start_codon:yes stop_codon:yes gene_type:complete